MLSFCLFFHTFENGPSLGGLNCSPSERFIFFFKFSFQLASQTFVYLPGFSSLTAQILMPCYFGGEVITKTERLLTDAYSLNWIILLVSPMARSTNHGKVTVTGFFVLKLETFANVNLFNLTLLLILPFQMLVFSHLNQFLFTRIDYAFGLSILRHHPKYGIISCLAFHVTFGLAKH